MSEQYHAVKEQLEERIAFEVADKALPSISYALVSRDGVIADGHVQQTDSAYELNDQSTFRIASQSKMFTSICLMQLVEKGLVDIDVPVSEYLPGFAPENPFAGKAGGPLGDDVTLRKLMSHTAGLVREPQSGNYFDDSNPTLEQTVAELAGSVLKNDPSIGLFSYSNAGMAVVGAVVERVTGQSFADYLSANILQPLGMSDSAIISNPDILARLAPAIMWTLDADTPAPVFDLGSPPAGNMYATLGDMSRFMTCLLRGGFSTDGSGIIAPDTLEQMWTVIGERPRGYAGLRGYGLGFGISELDSWRAVGHGGAVYGYASQLSVLPQAGLGMFMISTVDATNNVVNYLTNNGLRLALAAQNMGEIPKVRPRYPACSPTQLAEVPGYYKSSKNNEIVEIVVRNDRLYLLGDGMPLQLKPASDTEFFIDGRLYGEGSDYDHLKLQFPETGKIVWKTGEWVKITEPPSIPAGPEIAPHLGTYGPSINITTLSYQNGGLVCLMEYFNAHTCKPLGKNRFEMSGTLYPNEILELGAVDESGQQGIRVGPLFLARRN